MAELSSTSASRYLHDALREQKLPSHDIALILAILFYLRWADFQEAELEAIAAFDDTAYEPVLPASLHWRTWHQVRPNDLFHILTERLPAALRQLSNSRHNPLATHLHRISGPMERLSGIPSQSLFVLVQWLAEQPFETPNDRRQLLTIFDEFLYAKAYRLSGEFMTPPAIARLIVELAAPAPGERVYDPCFGSAGLLTAASEYVLHSKEKNCARYGMPCLDISGIELNESAYIIGLTRLALAGIDSPQLELGNSLERTPPDNPQQNGFDLVIAIPPFGMRINPEGLDHFPVRTNDATGLFVQHALAQLRPGGRSVIVVPQGFLFRGGPEKKLRQILLENHTVEAVIALPETTFLPLTAIKSSILILRRGGATKQIRMVDAEKFFERGKGRQPAIISESQARELAEKTRAQKPSDCCWDVGAKTLAETEFDFTPQRRDQSGLSAILETIRPEVQLVQLKDCCQIMIGRSIRSADLINESPRTHSLSDSRQNHFAMTQASSKQQNVLSTLEPIPFIRIKDIKKGQATRGSSWISAKVAVGIDGHCKLRAGDVLLSKSGTIGKVGIVRNGAVGAVAASGLYVLRVDSSRLDPHYLTAYLDSSDCRVWLMDRSTAATTIRHLSKRVIEEIPVPLPPLQMQQRVAAEYREHGVDVLAYLTQLLTSGDLDPIAKWVEKELKDLPTEIDTITDPLDLTLLDQLARHVRPLRNETAHGSHGESTLVPWLLAFNEAISTLRGVSEMPLGSGLLSVLQESVQGLKRAEAAIKGHLPNEGKARKLTSIVAGWLAQSCSKLLNTVQIIINADTAILHAGKVAEIVLKFQNKGLLPLREIEVSTSPDWGNGELGYLTENASTEFNLRILAPKIAEPLTLTVHWSALTLDGRQVEGTCEIPFEVSKVMPVISETVNRFTDLGASPYVCGDPVRPDRNDVFFGREDLLDQIRRQITFSGNVVLLEGNRRSGKSSVLWHLEGTDSVPGWLGVYCSLQGAEGSREGVGVPTTEVFREMAKSIAKGLQTLGDKTPLPDGTELPPRGKLGIAKACREGIGEASPFSDFRDYVEVALDFLAGRNLGLLLMLDEFDKIQEGIDSGVTSPQVPENIRFLVQTFPSFCAILTGSKRLKRLREEHWSALYGLGTRFGVTSLPAEHARRLVTEPVKDRLTYSPEAVERSIFLTSGQPYLLQCLCNRVFDMAAQLKMRSVTLDLVDQAGNALVQDNEHFASLWDYAGSERRRFLLALCHNESVGPDALRLGVIQERLLVHGIEINDETLITDLEYLRELELVELVNEAGGGHYVLAIPLMGNWIEKQQDFAAIKRKAKLETEDQHE